MMGPANQREVTIIATGVANTASVAAALRRCGAVTELTVDRDRVRTAEHLILPGVGSFAAGMACLREHDLSAVLRERVQSGRPTLAICLGMQLLFAESEESPGVKGLGIVDDVVRRFGDEVRIPQFGWNRVEAGDGCRLLESGWAYFANSYRAERGPDDWSCATADHGGTFIAAMERGGLLACQFHPELSGPWGLSLVRRWSNAGRSDPSDTQAAGEARC